jgi:amino acid adenylation domain-containing protein
VQRSPAAPALVFRNSTISYGDLARRAHLFAAELRSTGVCARDLIALSLARSERLIVAMLGILEAGAAYLPLDTGAPAAHAGSILDSAGVRFIVTEAGIERRADRSPSGSSRSIPPRVAAVLFTSGSSGKPRGVCVTHEAIARLVIDANYSRITPEDVLFQLAPVAFDASTFEIWGALLNGARLVLSSCEPLALDEVARAIQEHRVTILWLTSKLFELFVDAGFGDLGCIEQLLVGGEVLSVSHARRFADRAPRCALVNCYGPTENTTFSTFFIVDRNALKRTGAIPIGKPVSGTYVRVLDEAMQQVPVGVPGEACLGGIGLAAGYLDDVEATERRFIRDPIAMDSEARLYRTGDRVRLLESGDLEFLGRLDDQVKIRGHRVEPAEVEETLRAAPGALQAAVVARSPATELAAFVVVEGTSRATEATVRDFLRTRLPDYLVPARIQLVQRLPLTANGKIDRRALAGTEPAPIDVDKDDIAGDEWERKLSTLFEELLGAAPPRGSGFFELGGHSILAVKLLALIERTFGVRLPLAAPFEAPSVSQLAARIREAQISDGTSAVAPDATLVQLKSGASARPFFIMPGGNGGMIELAFYARLVRGLARDQAVYGLAARPERRYSSVALMAKDYLAEIRRVQARGPYLLAGECIGGVVAFEIAQQLEQAGEGVGMLLLMDAWCPSTVTFHRQPAARSAHALRVAGSMASAVARSVRLHAAALAGAPPGELWSMIKEKARRWLRRLAVRQVKYAPDGYYQVCKRYRARNYPGSITLLVSEESERLGLSSSWAVVAGGGLSRTVVKGDHHSYLREHFDETAEALKAFLEAGS